MSMMCAYVVRRKAIELNIPDEQDEFDYDEYVKTHLPEYDDYVGKHLLISLTYVDQADKVKYKVQMHGVITRINEAVIVVIRQDSGEEFTIPADMDALKVAGEGEYHLKPSGAVVVNPDYLAVWTITEPSAGAG